MMPIISMAGRIITQVYLNEFSITRLNRALDVVTGPGGTPICRSVRDGTDPLCVPYNVFGGAGAASAASVAYLSATGFQKGQTVGAGRERFVHRRAG